MNRDPSTHEKIPSTDKIEGSPELLFNPSRFPSVGSKPDFSGFSANFSSESFSLDTEDPASPLAAQYRYVPYPSDSTLTVNSAAIFNTPTNGKTPYSETLRVQRNSAFLADGFDDTSFENNTHAFDMRSHPLDSINQRRLSETLAALRPASDSENLSRSFSPRCPLSPQRARSPIRSSTSPQRRLSPHKRASPSRPFAFNFKPQEVNDGLASLAPMLKPSQRKGHRYKHSSVSMNLFQEPVALTEPSQQPELLPDLFLIPTVRELLASTTKLQRFKLSVAFVHALASGLVFFVGVKTNRPAFSTLAHLVFYDSLTSIIIAGVDAMSNFEVWSKSSIAYPFGLGRLEVLAAFALSTSLIMVGCDLISHFVELMVLDLVSGGEHSEHSSHHIHNGSGTEPDNWILYETVLAAVVAVTWLSSLCIASLDSITDLLHGADRKSIKGSRAVPEKGLLDSASELALVETKSGSRKIHLKQFLKLVRKNPIRILTVLDALFLSVVPFVPPALKEQVGFDLNETATFVVAATLCYVGWTMAQTLGGILLISFPYSDHDYNVLKASIYDKVLALPNFKPSYSISKIFLAKANYRLYIAGLDVSMIGGSSEDESRAIYDITKIITLAISEFDDESQVETTVSASR